MPMSAKRQSILCPNCRKLISSSEAKCPYCGTAHPGSWYKHNAWTTGLRDPAQFIKYIIGVNAGMYILSIVFNAGGAGVAMNPLTFLSPANDSLFLLGATGAIPIDRFQRYWTLISAGYLHGSILHIFFNMVALYQLASIVIREFGVYRMFAIYTLSGIFGFWVSYMAGVALTIGASASVLGLIGAILFYGKSRGGIYGRSLYKQVAVWTVLIFIFGLVVRGINNWGHAGGLLAGIGLGFLLGYQEKKKETLFHKMLAGACAIATLAALFWAVSTAVYYSIAG